MATVVSAKLRLFGSIHSPEAPAVGVYTPAGTSWTDSGLTWNNRPTAGTAAPATQTVSTSTAKWYEWDVTSYLRAEKAAGRNVVTLVLRSLVTMPPYMIFNSADAAADQPQLQIVP